MRWLISLYRRARGLIKAETIHREIEEEAQFHIDMHTAENIGRGMSPEDARLDAGRRYGNLTRLKEAGYEIRGGGWLEPLWLDLSFGARMLRKNLGFTMIAGITLALGIGANAAIFSVVNAVLQRPLPYKDPQRLVMIFGTRSSAQDLPIGREFNDLRRENHVFEHVAAFGSQSLNMTGSGEPELLGNVTISPNLFTLLGREPIHGRAFLPEEEQWGNHRVVILSHNLWQRRFGSDPQVIGRTITLNDEPYIIAGVAPPDFQFPNRGVWQAWFPSRVDIYTPLALTPEQMNSRRYPSHAVVARLKPQFSIDQAQAEMSGFAERLRQQYPATNRDKGIRVVAFHQQVVGRAKLPLLVLLGAVGFVLLIGCANVANLLLVRAAARQKEIAIRVALGAGRWRVIRQLLTESVLLAILSGSFALLLALWAVNLLQKIIPADLPRADQIGIDARVFGFTLLISLLTSVVFGLVPAIQASRCSVNEMLKEGGRCSGGTGQHHFRNLLVVSEVALALVLLTGAGLMLRSFVRLISVDPGLDPQNVLTLGINLPGDKYRGPHRGVFFQQVLERLRAQPGILAASAVWPLPLSGMDDTIGFRIEGQPPPTSNEWPGAGPRPIGTDYFKVMKIPLKKGRVFTGNDSGTAAPVVIINEEMARQYFPNQDPISRRLMFNDGQSTWREIVGVVGDVRHMALDRGLRPEIYWPITHYHLPMSAMTLVVRTNGDPLDFVAAVRNQVHAIDKDRSITNIQTMEEILARSISQRRFNLLLLAVFAGLALLLAGVGIYGVMSYLVAQRRHEIGVRMALGAQSRDVLVLVVGQGMALTLTGVVIGLIAAFGLTRLIKNLLFSVSTTDSMTFSMIALLLAGIAMFACYIPARRATKVDPLLALRCE